MSENILEFTPARAKAILDVVRVHRPTEVSIELLGFKGPDGTVYPLGTPFPTNTTMTAVYNQDPFVGTTGTLGNTDLNWREIPLSNPAQTIQSESRVFRSKDIVAEPLSIALEERQPVWSDVRAGSGDLAVADFDPKVVRAIENDMREGRMPPDERPSLWRRLLALIGR